MTNFVFFNAVDATVKVTVNDAVIGYADDAAGLVEMFLRTGLTSKDTFMHSRHKKSLSISKSAEKT